MPTENPQNLVGTGEAAKALGINRTTLARWAADGIVRPAQKTIKGGHMRWNIDDLKAQIARHEAAGPGTAGRP